VCYKVQFDIMMYTTTVTVTDILHLYNTIILLVDLAI